METLIELYDDRAIENVIGPETFRPKQIIYLCPTEVAQNRGVQKVLRDFFVYRGLKCNIEFVEISFYKTDKIYNQLIKIADSYNDCALDVTGGTDAALIAAGMFCKETGIPTFTYSRRNNKFYDITNAEFAEGRPCDLEYKVEDYFKMVGGKMRGGRVDNSSLKNYMDKFDPFFEVYLEHKKKWVDNITFMQRISKPRKDEDYALNVSGSYIQKGERGSRISADEEFLNKLCKIGFIKDLNIISGESVSFSYVDSNYSAWLRDVGSVLELYMFKACVDAGIFGDVISSAIVDWNGTVGHGAVSNEIDVVASRGVIPLFISCKACDVKTEALNELAILKDRFGGKGAKAIIATTEQCNAAARHRAAQLGITVIDEEELKHSKVSERLKIVMKVKNSRLSSNKR